MGCTHDAQSFVETNINVLMFRKKTLIEELTGYDQKPTKEDKRQMEIIDKQMVQELSNLKDKNISNEESKKKNNTSLYLLKKCEFENLTIQWEKLLTQDDSIRVNNIKDNDENGCNGFSSESFSVKDSDNENENEKVSNHNDYNHSININLDSEDDSSKFAREEYEKYGTECQ